MISIPTPYAPSATTYSPLSSGERTEKPSLLQNILSIFSSAKGMDTSPKIVEMTTIKVHSNEENPAKNPLATDAEKVSQGNVRLPSSKLAFGVFLFTASAAALYYFYDYLQAVTNGAPITSALEGLTTDSSLDETNFSTFIFDYDSQNDNINYYQGGQDLAEANFSSYEYNSDFEGILID